MGVGRRHVHSWHVVGWRRSRCRSETAQAETCGLVLVGIHPEERFVLWGQVQFGTIELIAIWISALSICFTIGILIGTRIIEVDNVHRSFLGWHPRCRTQATGMHRIIARVVCVLHGEDILQVLQRVVHAIKGSFTSITTAKGLSRRLSFHDHGQPLSLIGRVPTVVPSI